MNEVNDENGGDTSDSDNENGEEASDDEENLSFESDEDGNYQAIASRIGADNSDASESEDLDDEEEGGDEEDDEIESGDEVENDDSEAEYESGDSEDLSFEEESDPNESEDELGPSSIENKDSVIQQNKKKKNDVSALNGTGAKKETNKKQTPEQSSNKNKDATSSLEAFKNELNKSETNPTGKEKVIDEYEEHDTDDEEDIRNTVGNIPMQWYDEYKHIGYDWDAKKIIKPAKRDQLDDFLKRMEDPNFWRTVKDPQTGQDVILSDADIELIKRINSRRIPDSNFDDYTVSIQFYRLIIFVIIDLEEFFGIFSHGSIGLHPKLNGCQFVMCLIISVHSFRLCLKRRKFPNWCMQSKWVG